MKNYKTDKEFLEKYLKVVELQEGDARVLLAPGLQGRVMTSTGSGEAGPSFGWLNYDLISSGKTLPHCNNWGGEDRYWLGPEGGQFSIFFPQGTDFGFADWQTPAVIDTDGWEVTGADRRSASFSKRFSLKNTSGHDLDVQTDRTVMVLPSAEIGERLGVKIPAGVTPVGFVSENRLKNAGTQPWNRERGMLSVWILGQFVPSDKNTIIIPFRKAAGEAINDSYFGKIDADRLRTVDDVLLFTGDGRKRGKIGTPPAMTLPLVGAYDAENKVLTVVTFNFDPKNTTYVNSMWEQQAEPFRGDVVNSYNDGPLEDGSIMGPFYEIETSSPAAELAPGESLTHSHATFHFTGPEEALDGLCENLFGLKIAEL